MAGELEEQLDNFSELGLDECSRDFINSYAYELLRILGDRDCAKDVAWHIAEAALHRYMVRGLEAVIDADARHIGDIAWTLSTGIDDSGSNLLYIRLRYYQNGVEVSYWEGEKLYEVWEEDS
jgi:predicted metal-dependent phosphotriesterase family hydrolase